MTGNMLTRSVAMGRPRAVYRENRTPELDGTLVASLMEEVSVNTELYNSEVGGAMDALPKKHVAHQRKTWSTTECKELRKWRQEGQSFSKLSTVRALLLNSNYETSPFVNINIALWCVSFRRDPAVLQGNILIE